MSRELWLLETDEGIFLLERIGSGYICNISDFLNDHYLIKKIASKIGGPVDTEKEYHGSLKTDMGIEKIHLTVVNNGKDIFSIAVQKLYKIHELDPRYCLIPEEKKRIDALEK